MVVGSTLRVGLGNESVTATLYVRRRQVIPARVVTEAFAPSLIQKIYF
jgi:hypothetical protein